MRPGPQQKAAVWDMQMEQETEVPRTDPRYGKMGMTTIVDAGVIQGCV